MQMIKIYHVWSQVELVKNKKVCIGKWSDSGFISEKNEQSQIVK